MRQSFYLVEQAVSVERDLVLTSLIFSLNPRHFIILSQEFYLGILLSFVDGGLTALYSFAFSSIFDTYVVVKEIFE